jgi:predicted DNA-binding transcriptional regulator YafY
MDYSSRISRLLRLICLIQSEQGWTPKRLAEEFGTSERNVYRDIEKLKEAGLPITYDKGAQTYRIDRKFFLPPVRLDAEEALALAALCERISEPEQIPFLSPALRALRKIEGQLPRDIADELRERLSALAIRTARAMPPDGFKDVYDRMLDAIAGRRALLCKYDAVASSDPEFDPDVEFDFEPYAVFFAVRAWYAVGRRSDREGLRTLKLNRFAKLAATNRPYDIPSSFSLEDHLGNAWNMINSGAEADVELIFDPAFAETIAETRWHPTQETEPLPDGSCRFTATVAGLDEIVWWILSMGPHCRVVRPAELARRVRELASATADLYDGRPG